MAVSFEDGRSNTVRTMRARAHSQLCSLFDSSAELSLRCGEGSSQPVECSFQFPSLRMGWQEVETDALHSLSQLDASPDAGSERPAATEPRCRLSAFSLYIAQVLGNRSKTPLPAAKRLWSTVPQSPQLRSPLVLQPFPIQQQPACCFPAVSKDGSLSNLAQPPSPADNIGKVSSLPNDTGLLGYTANTQPPCRKVGALSEPTAVRKKHEGGASVAGSEVTCPSIPAGPSKASSGMNMLSELRATIASQIPLRPAWMAGQQFSPPLSYACLSVPPPEDTTRRFYTIFEPRLDHRQRPADEAWRLIDFITDAVRQVSDRVRLVYLITRPLGGFAAPQLVLTLASALPGHRSVPIDLREI